MVVTKVDAWRLLGHLSKRFFDLSEILVREPVGDEFIRHFNDRQLGIKFLEGRLLEPGLEFRFCQLERSNHSNLFQGHRQFY